MTRIVEWLLGLDNIRWGRDAPLYLKWDVHPPPWLLFGLALVTLAVVGLIYRAERGSTPRKVVLAALRLALMALVGALICGPSLVLERNRTEPSYVALLVDRSESMSRAESYPEGSLAGEATEAAGLAEPAGLIGVSRLQLARTALLRNDAAPLRKLLEKNRLLAATFAGDVEFHGTFDDSGEIGRIGTFLKEIVPDGTTTDLVRAVEKTISAAQGRRLAAVILVSDGQATVSTSLKDAIELARGRQVPIYPFRLGSPVAPVDVEVGPARADESVYLYDVLAVSCDVRVSGIAGPATIPLRLVDERNQQVVGVAEAPLTPDHPAGAVEFRLKPARVGLTRYRIEAPPLPNERVTDNNVEFVEINVLDARLRVLFVEGYPRYEYRYLKNALVREPTIEASVLLLEADEQFVQEGTDPIRRFPETPEELGRYDVVLFGDVDPRAGWLSPSQLNMLLDFVGNDGRGFGVIAGARAAPHRFLGSPLEKLLPVRIDPDFHGHYDVTLTSGFQPALTPEGKLSGILRLAVGRAAVASSPSLPEGPAPAPIPALETTAVFDSLPELFWIARVLGSRPGASVLLEHPGLRTRTGTAGIQEAMPVLATGRYGAGRLLYQGTDDTWRWRRHRIGAAPIGELLHDAYWVQVVRLLSKPQSLMRDRRYDIRTDRKVYEFSERVQVVGEVFSPELVARLGDTLRLVVEEFSPATMSELRTAAHHESASVPVETLEAKRRAQGSGLYEGAIVPPRPGRFTIRADGISPTPGERPVVASIRVQRPDLEQRRPEADHEALERLAEGTGGDMLALNQLEAAFSEIRERSVQVPDDLVEPLWDSRLALLLFALLITAEWTLRKLFGLL